jgi:hypothetical protein
MSRTRAGNWLLLVFRAVHIFHGQRFRPVLPVPIANDDGDRRSDGMRMPHTGHNLGAILFDLHAPAAAIALLAAPKFVIYGVERDRHSGGKSCEGGYQALAVRLPGGFKSQHLPRSFMVTEARSAPHRYISRRPSIAFQII